MSVLKSIKISGFKSILDLELDLGRLNVFVGSNGSGKSNVLEAIGTLSAAIAGEIEYNGLSSRGVRLSTPDVFRSAFKNRNRRMTIELEGRFPDLMYRANLFSTAPQDDSNNPFSYFTEMLCRGANYTSHIAGRSNHGASILNKSIKKPHTTRSVVLAAESLGILTEYEEEVIDGLRNFALYAPSTPILRGVSNDSSEKLPLGLYGGNLAEAFSEVAGDKKKAGELLSFFELMDWLQMISTDLPNKALQSRHVHTGTDVLVFKDNYMSKSFNKLYAYDVSEGALYILFLLVLMIHKKSPCFFALDNIDSALNPKMVTSLILKISKMLKTNPRKQILMTTHNPTSLDALDLFDNDHRLFITRRGDDGSTKIERISPPEGMTRDDWDRKFYGMKLSEIWLSGALGGLPKGIEI